MIDNNSLSDQLSAQVGTPVTVTRTSQDLREINGRYRIDANINENPARLWVDCDTGVIYSYFMEGVALANPSLLPGLSIALKEASKLPTVWNSKVLLEMADLLQQKAP